MWCDGVMCPLELVIRIKLLYYRNVCLLDASVIQVDGVVVAGELAVVAQPLHH